MKPSSTTRYKQKEIEQTINIPLNQDVKQRMKDYLRQRNYVQEQLEQEKLALQLQLQTQQLELWALKNQQVLEEQTKKQQAETIKSQQAEIQQLETELKEKETEIIRLNEELNTKIDDWIQKGTQIKQLEAKIEGMAEANEKNTQKNQLLEHEINKLKEDLRKEKEKHSETQLELQRRITKFNILKTEYEQKQEELKEKTTKWSEIGGTVRTKVYKDIDHLVQGTKNKWNKFKNWFS